MTVLSRTQVTMLPSGSVVTATATFQVRGNTAYISGRNFQLSDLLNVARRFERTTPDQVTVTAQVTKGRSDTWVARSGGTNLSFSTRDLLEACSNIEGEVPQQEVQTTGSDASDGGFEVTGLYTTPDGNAAVVGPDGSSYVFTNGVWVVRNLPSGSTLNLASDD